jgi:hypothetical protein
MYRDLILPDNVAQHQELISLLVSERQRGTPREALLVWLMLSKVYLLTRDDCELLLTSADEVIREMPSLLSS